MSEDQQSSMEPEPAALDFAELDGYALADEDGSHEPGASLLQRLQKQAKASQQQSLTSTELESRQLTLFELIVAVSVVSVILAPISFLPLAVYSGVLGFVVSLLVVFAAILRPHVLVVQLTLWIIVGLYVLVLLFSIREQMIG